MDSLWSPPGIFQARIPEWVAISFFRGFLQSRDKKLVSLESPALAGRFSSFFFFLALSHLGSPPLIHLLRLVAKSCQTLWDTMNCSPPATCLISMLSCLPPIVYFQHRNQRSPTKVERRACDSLVQHLLFWIKATVLTRDCKTLFKKWLLVASLTLCLVLLALPHPHNLLILAMSSSCLHIGLYVGSLLTLPGN